MSCRHNFVSACIAMLTTVSAAQYVETNKLVGLHFFSDQNANGGLAAAPVYTDAEAVLGDTGGPVGSTNIAGNGGGWLLDFVATDTDSTSAPFWNWAWQGGAFGPTNKTADGYMSYSFRRATQGGKKNTPIVRIHPQYGRNVPHPSDPYTNANFASDAKAVAQLMKDTARYYVIGNEVNIRDENHRYTRDDGSLKLYDTLWEPTPEQYADCYMAVRDQIITITTGSAGRPIPLMQPVSPSQAGGVVFMDGNEFLWRQIKRVNSVDPSKVEGFAIHSYAEPGGPDFGNEGFMDAVREQLCIIGQLGHYGKPVFLTEFNKDMPDLANHNIGISFVQRAYQTLAAWNAGTGGTIPGLANQNIVGTCWFVHPSSGASVGDGWNRMSLEYWKGQIPSPTSTTCVWHSFQGAAKLNYPRGANGGGAAWPQSSSWWRDDFAGSSLDTTPALPDWYLSTGSGGTVGVSGGVASFRGNGNTFGNADIRTRGYVFGDFTFASRFTFVNASKAGASSPEANFDIRLREGSSGYSLTFFSTPSPANSGRVVLRRTGLWTQVGSFNAAVAGGINSGDTFEARVTATGDTLAIRVYKNGSPTPAVSWDVTDAAGPKVGWVRLGSYAIAQVDVDYATVGGPLWDFTGAASTGPNSFREY